MSNVVDLKDFKKKKGGEARSYLTCDCASIFYAIVIEPPDLIMICVNCEETAPIEGVFIDEP